MQAQRVSPMTRPTYLFLAIAFFSALLLAFLTPLQSKAYSILQRSEPAANELLLTAPTEVHLWFSEDLNSTLSIGMVHNAEQKRVDLGNRLARSDARKMIITLQSPLPPGIYTIYWRTVAGHDGQTLTGTSTFRVTSPDGTLPQGSRAPNANNPFGASPISNGELDTASVLYFLMTTLIAIGATFWVGTLLWRAFVTRQRTNETGEQAEVSKRETQLFDQKLATPLLTLLFIANIGVLLSNSLALSQGILAQIIPNAVQLLTTGNFGTYWLLQQLLLIVALFVPASATSRAGFLAWGKIVLGVMLLFLLALSGHAFSSDSGALTLGADWLHWLGTAMWVGGMFYIAWVYLPAQQGLTTTTRGEALLKTLGKFSPLALTGLLLLVITGPFSASAHLSSWGQLITTPYGRILIVKCTILCLLLLVGSIQDLLVRPSLQKDYKKIRQLQEVRNTEDGDSLINEDTKKIETHSNSAHRTLESLLRWEAVIGIALLVCSGLMSVYAATVTPAQPQTATSSQTTPAGPFTGTARTSDNQFNVQLSVLPAHVGPNDFTVKVLDNQGKAVGSIQVSLTADMLDMSMGVTRLALQPDGQGNFSATGNLTMSGNWKIDIHIRTADNAQHTASFRFHTS